MLHFLFVLNYSSPLNKTPASKLDFYAINYCYPYFYQDWRLFAPCPDRNYMIYAIYDVNTQKHYALPLQEILYQRNLLNGKEFLMLATTASVGYLQKEKELSKDIYRIKRDKAYDIFTRVITSYLEHKHQGEIKNLKLIVDVELIKTKTSYYLIDE